MCSIQIHLVEQLAYATQVLRSTPLNLTELLGSCLPVRVYACACAKIAGSTTHDEVVSSSSVPAPHVILPDEEAASVTAARRNIFDIKMWRGA